ncbi:hypothetical protein ASZ90_014079 [hydrocarbon metagenome]|uniref:Uncharacterized protein n=1 Tax=hydrocarbon metagenome TaxID=938273 RepID=A0A0W8F5R4_9ZZZZ
MLLQITLAIRAIKSLYQLFFYKIWVGGSAYQRLNSRG